MSQGSRPDGLTPKILVARFRSEFKDRLVSAVVEGYGSMMVHAGVRAPWVD